MTANIVAPNCLLATKCSTITAKLHSDRETAPKYIGPYTIVKVHDKGNYTVKDKNGKQLPTKVCTSNLKL